MERPGLRKLAGMVILVIFVIVYAFFCNDYWFGNVRKEFDYSSSLFFRCRFDMGYSCGTDNQVDGLN